MAQYHELARQSQHFDLRNRLSIKDLTNELTEFGWGAYLHPACHFDKLYDAHYAIRPFAGRASRYTDYLSAGLPLLTSDEHEEIKDWIDSHEIGLSVNKDDLTSVSEMIQDSNYARLRRNVYEFCHTHLDWQNWTKMVLDLYRSHF